MKVLSQLLGRYSNNHKPLILFRLPDTDTLFYRLSDIEPIFKLPPLPFTKTSAFKNCYRDNEDTYLNTQVLSEIAGQFNKHLLAELCKLKPNDYNVGLADAILQTFPEFKRAPQEEHIWESVQLPLENLEDVVEREVKTEPSSPPSVNQVIPAEATRGQNAMALDKVLLNSSELRRQSVLDLEKPAKKQKTSNGPEREKRPHSLSAVTTATTATTAGAKHIRKLHSYPPIISEDQTPQQQQSQPEPSEDALISNKKRLSIKHKNALNLTIFAPSYNEQLTGVRSAPINSNFNKSTQPQHHLQQQQHHYQQHQKLPHHHQQQQQQNKYVVGSSHLVPASATISRAPYHHQPSPRRHEFAIPPIVPSQQQPPHTAHPTSRENMSYQQYMASPSLYGSHPHSKPHPPPPQTTSAAAVAAAYSHAQSKRNHELPPQIAVTAASAPLPPKTPTTNSFAALQRQQYLQPFEHLFDTIETTRTLKSTLDDQIRRSSSLMQTLQASATTIEGLVRNQVKEAQWEMMTQMEQTVEGLVRRIEAIENRLDRASASHQNSTTPTTLESNKSNNRRLPEQQNSARLPSPLPSATTTKEERAAAEDLVAFSERRRENHHSHQPPSSSLSSSDELQTPPTIVRSQNDIGPQEYHNMLNTLRDRLDRLERQIET